MTSVILCNRLNRLKRTLKNRRLSIRYVRLDQSRHGIKLTDYLSEYPGAEELQTEPLFRQRADSFRRKYIDFLGNLNIKNHSLHWWSMPFTNKNPMTTSLCRDISSFLLITDLLKEVDGTLIIISDSQDLSAQVKTYCLNQGTDCLNLVANTNPIRRIIKFHSPAGPLKASLRTFLLRLASPAFHTPPKTQENHIVVCTLLHPSGFLGNRGFQDPYFGPLIDHIKQSGRAALILGVPAEQPWKTLRKVKAHKHRLNIYPVESFLTFKGLVASTWTAIKLAMGPIDFNGPAEIDGIDVNILVRRSINEAVHNGDVMLNLRLYQCARNLSKSLNIFRCLYPYENRSWEKMLVLGIRDVSPKSDLVGYQHTSITRSHTNFIFSEAENKILPLPNTILTTGQVVKTWLENEGRYPKGVFKSACALRQRISTEIESKPRNHPLQNVFVPLATSLQEYIKTLILLEDTFYKRPDINLRIRPHPIIPINSALKLAPLKNLSFYSISDCTLDEDLDWADVVLYASSTVAMEAVSRGIPAVQLNLGEFLDTDPMIGFTDFKWTVHDKRSLLAALQEINEIPYYEFSQLQESARDYVKAYLRPITRSTLEAFIS